MIDQMNDINPRFSNAPQVSTADTPVVGAIIDRQGFDALTYLIITGSLGDADATFAVSLQDGDAANLSDAATVTAATGLLGTAALASFLFSDDNKCFKLGYVGEKRYTRLTITSTGNSATPSGAFFAAMAVLAEPSVSPTVNPPV